MHLDSHRRQLSFSVSRYLRRAPVPTPAIDLTSSEPTIPVATTTTTTTDHATTNNVTMPCRFSRRANCCKAISTFTADDGTEMQPWHSVRREFLFDMRRQVKYIVLVMAMMEAIRVGPTNIVYAGKEGFPARGVEDYGISYNVGYFISWLFVCLFSTVWVPMFSWWVPNSTPSDSEHPGYTQRLADSLRDFNMLLLPISVAISMIVYIGTVVRAFVYVDARPVESRALPKNTQKNWMARLMLLAGVLVSTTCGYASFQILADMDLAHVKCVEYCVIVLPIQINIGVLMGTVMQYKMEKRINRKKVAFSAAMEEGSIDEKKPILQI